MPEGIKYIQPKLNSLGQRPQDKRWCLKFAIEDAKLEGLEPESKEWKAFIKKRVDELFKIHGLKDEILEV